MQNALAHFVTSCARVTAYEGYVKIVSSLGKARLTLHGTIARNFFGNQECLNALTEIREVTRLVGSSTSTEEEGVEGRTHLDLVFERLADNQYRIGYEGDMDATVGVLIDNRTINAIVKACRISHKLSEQEDFVYDDDFWVVHATVGDDEISVSGEIFEIIPVEGPKITIPLSNMAEWLLIFEAAEDIAPFGPGTMMPAGRLCRIVKVAEDQLNLIISLGDRRVVLKAEPGLLTICYRLMSMLWLGEDIFDDDFAFLDLDDEDEDDDDVVN